MLITVRWGPSVGAVILDRSIETAGNDDDVISKLGDEGASHDCLARVGH